MGDALAKLKAAGVELVEADIPGLMDLNNKLSFPIALYEVTVDLPAYAKKFGIKLDLKGYAETIASPDVKGLFGALVKGEPPTIPKKVYEEAMKVHRPALIKAYADYFAKEKVVAMAFPTVPLPAAPIGDDDRPRLRRPLHDERHGVPRRCRGQSCRHVRDRRSDVDRLEPHGHRARVDAGEIEDVVDQTA